ncbi:MAG: ComEA family DNA-binding protein [Vicinamibacteria bacterium]
MKLQRIVSTGLAFVLALAATTGLALAAGKPGRAAKAAPTAKVNINTASVQQLVTLPGVGEKVAARIVEYRQKSGGFKSASELVNVRGIGEKNLHRIEAYLTTGDAKSASAK